MNFVVLKLHLTTVRLWRTQDTFDHQHRAKEDKLEKETTEYEEKYFVRMPVSKKQKVRKYSDSCNTPLLCYVCCILYVGYLQFISTIILLIVCVLVSLLACRAEGSNAGFVGRYCVVRWFTRSRIWSKSWQQGIEIICNLVSLCCVTLMQYFTLLWIMLLIWKKLF